MNLYDKRDTIARCFKRTCGETNSIGCEAYHFCENKNGRRNKNSEETKTCYFKKIMGNVLCSKRAEDIRLCHEWRNKGIGIALCTMIKRRGMKMNEICGDWKTIDLNKLANIVAHAGCFEMYRIWQENSGESDGYECVLEYAALCGCIDIVKICERHGVTNFNRAMTFAAQVGISKLSSCAKCEDRETSVKLCAKQLLVGRSTL